VAQVKECVLLSTWHINIGKFKGWFRGSYKEVSGVSCLHHYVFSERSYVQPKYAVYMPTKEYGTPSIIIIIIIIIIINS
jgi:hypothetical protein